MPLFRSVYVVYGGPSLLVPLDLGNEEWAALWVAALPDVTMVEDIVVAVCSLENLTTVSRAEEVVALVGSQHRGSLAVLHVLAFLAEEGARERLATSHLELVRVVVVMP